MSAKVDKFCDGLKDRLHAVEARVESVKANVHALPGKAEKAVHDKIEEARGKIRTQKERIEKTKADLKAWGEQKRSETQAMVKEWKEKHEVKKLNARAERAEAYAEGVVAFAMATMDEAEEAVLEAVAARMDADAVQ